MPQSVVTAELKEQAVELAKQQGNASQELVDRLMSMNAKSLVEEMKKMRRMKMASPPSGEVGDDEDSGVPINRFSAFS